MFTQESSFEENRAALIKLSKVQLVHFCVHLWEKRYPKDLRPRKAIEAAEQWLIDKNTNAARAAANAAYFAANAAASWAANAAWAAAANAADANAAWTADDANAAGQKWQWISKLYSSIYKEQLFPQSWKTTDAINVAKSILSLKSFKDMPILADALEDAGCTDSEILGHLRNDEGLWTSVDWMLINLTKE